MPFFTRTTDTQNTSADRVALVIGATGESGREVLMTCCRMGFGLLQLVVIAVNWVCSSPGLSFTKTSFIPSVLTFSLLKM